MLAQLAFRERASIDHTFILVGENFYIYILLFYSYFFFYQLVVTSRTRGQRADGTGTANCTAGRICRRAAQLRDYSADINRRASRDPKHAPLLRASRRGGIFRQYSSE